MNSTNPKSIRLLRDVDAYMVPSGDEVKLLAGNLVRITQALGGNYTVIMNGNMVQIKAENADALGIEVKEQEKTEGIVYSDLVPTYFKIDKDYYVSDGFLGDINQLKTLVERYIDMLNKLEESYQILRIYSDEELS